MDFVYVVVCVAFFAASVALVRLCSRLGGVQ